MSLAKKRAYESCIREVEHSTFTPLVFSATGAMGHEATIFLQKIASLLSEKWKEPYASVLDWVRYVNSLFACYVQPYNVSEESGHHKAFT